MLIIIPIGGADMPVVISIFNSHRGGPLPASASPGNMAPIVTAALVGSSGAILSYIMCKGTTAPSSTSFLVASAARWRALRQALSTAGEARLAEDVADPMKNASKAIIVPVYGMAVAQAQDVLRETADGLKKAGVEAEDAIHPVAERMPGHMNVLLAKANVPYDEVFELEDINSEFAQSDVAYVIGANDVTNPAVEDDPSSPTTACPSCKCGRPGPSSSTSGPLASGYAGIDNPLSIATTP